VLCYVPNSIVNGILCNVIHTTSKWHSLQFIGYTCDLFIHLYDINCVDTGTVLCVSIAENWGFLTVCGLVVQVMILGRGSRRQM